MKQLWKRLVCCIAILAMLSGAAVLPAAANATLSNLYDPATASIGWVNGEGASSPDNGFRTSAPIAVTEGDVITFGAAVSMQGWHMVTMNAQQSIIGGVDIHTGIEQEEVIDDTTSVMSYTVPEGVSFIRLIVDTRYDNAYLVTKNQPFTAKQYKQFWHLDVAFNNLFDATDAFEGYIDGSGNQVAGPGFLTLAPMEVATGDVITFGPAVATQGWHMITLDANKAVTGNATIAAGLTKVADLEDGTAIFSYTVPTNVSYIRILIESRLQDKMLITKNQSFNAAEYNEFIGSNQENPDKPSPLNGKTALFCGDSICYGQWDNEPRQGWAGRIAKAYGMTADNPAVGGTTFSTVRSGRILSQVESTKNKKYDYVILQGGVNDAWGSIENNVAIPAEVGKISDSFDVKDFDITTFAGGLEELLYYTIQYHPESIIGFITNFTTPLGASQKLGATGDMSAYYYEALKICEKWGVQVLDLYNDPYVSKTLMKTNTYTYLRDPLHPNAAGYDQLAPYIGDWMETLVPREQYIKNPYAGKKVLFAGDSIAYGFGDSVQGRAWAGRMADELGIIADNKAIVGASVSTIRDARIVHQINLPNNYYDYVIMHGGVNDSWGNQYDPEHKSAPVGEVTPGYNRSDFNTATFAGALEQLFSTARKNFPAARLGFILNFEIPSADCDDVGIYQEVTLEICRKWQVACLDMYGDNVRGTLLENNATKYMYDGGHPNAAGYDKLTPYIIDWFKTIPYTDTAILKDKTVYSKIIPVNQTIDQIGEVTKENYTEKLTAIEEGEAAVQALVDTYGKGILPMIGQYTALVGARTAYNNFVAPPPTLSYGDVNDDGDIDAKDALMVLKASVGKLTLNETETQTADVDGSGELDAVDALWILKKSVKKVDRFPVEEAK